MAVADRVAAPPLPVEAAPSTGERLLESLRIVLGSSRTLAGLALVGFWVIVAIFADDCVVSPACWVRDKDYEPIPWLARYSALEQFSGDQRQGPSAEHWLGTDKLGRDLWARLAYGSRVILFLAPVSVLLSMIVGAFMGVVAGYRGGMMDEVLMRALDAWLAFPTILLYLVIISAVGPSAWNVVIAIALGGAPGIARMVRSLTLDIKTRDFVAAAETRGESPWYIMFVEILPNARGPILVDAMLRVGYAVFAIGTLGFLGLGLPPPTPDWGGMVAAGRPLMQAGHIWDALWGSIAIAMLVVGLNMAADGINHELGRYN
jgi:peptide/nickel transport system permease protein